MKKLTVALMACFSLMTVAFAQQAEMETQEFQRKETRTVTPICFSIQGDDAFDVVGLRLSLYGTCETMTGLDLGLVSTTAQNAYGLQIALGRNKVVDVAGALQIAIGSNYAADMAGMQIGLWNETTLARGIQVGLVNVSHDVRGLQIGLVNTTEIIYGYQVGLINVIRGGFVPFFPGLNFMFAED